jgi:hypothetical protein
MKLNKNQLSVVVKSIIKEEIEKFQKKVLIEGKKKKLMKELEILNENDGSKRLSKVAMELNMSIDSVAKELTRLTGSEMEPNPNLKISPEFYELLTQKPNFEEIGEISIENGFVNFLPLGNYGKRMSLTNRADIVGLLNGEGGKKGDVEFESYYDNFGKHGINGKKKFVQYITDALKSAGFKLRDIGDFEQAQELYKLFAPKKKSFEDNLWNEEFEMSKGVNESENKKTTKKQITMSELRQIIKESIESFESLDNKYKSLPLVPNDIKEEFYFEFEENVYDFGIEELGRDDLVMEVFSNSFETENDYVQLKAVVTLDTELGHDTIFDRNTGKFDWLEIGYSNEKIVKLTFVDANTGEDKYRLDDELTKRVEGDIYECLDYLEEDFRKQAKGWSASY